MMNKLTPSTQVFALQPNTPTGFQREYKLPLDPADMEFLQWFFVYISSDGYQKCYFFEVATLDAFARKHELKFLHAEGGKIKVKLPVMIALKRMLYEAQLPSHASDLRNALLFKIDPLTVGIY